MKLEDIIKEFTAISEQEGQNRERQLDDLRFGMADDQWPAELRRMRENDGDGPRPCLTINKIQAHAKQITNNMRQNRSAIRVLPVDEAADVETAEILQGMIRHIEHASNASMAYDIAGDYQVMCGIGYFRIDTEVVDPLYNYQDIVVRPIRNPFSVYFDPWTESVAGEDSKRAFVVDSVTRKEYEHMFPGADAVDWSGVGRGDGWIEADRIRIAEHYWIEEYKQQYVFVQPRVAEFGMLAPPPEPVLAESIKGFEDSVVVLSEIEVDEQRLRWQKLSGAEVLEGGEEGQVMPGKYIPIVRVPGEDFYVENERYTIGLVRRSRDAQRLYNYAASVNAEVSAMQPKAPWVAGIGAISGYEEYYSGANTRNFPFLPYNEFDDQGRPLTPPMRQPPPQPSASTLSLMETSDRDLQAVTGQFGATMGEATNERSGLAIHNRQKGGEMATYHFTDNMGHAIRHAGRIIVDLIPKIYDTKRVARILGEDGTPESINIDPENAGEHEDSAGKIERIYDVGIGKYDVAITTGPSFATRREESFESMARLIESNPALWQIFGDLLVGSMDWPNSDEIAKRIKAAIPAEVLGEDDEGAQIAQLTQQLQEMQMTVDQTTMQLDTVAAEKDRLENIVKTKEADKEIAKMKLTADLADNQENRKVDVFNAETKRIDSRQDHTIAQANTTISAAELALKREMAELKEDMGVMKQLLSSSQKQSDAAPVVQVER